MQLRHLRAAHRDGHRVIARVARGRLDRRKTVVFCVVVVIVVGYRCLVVLMRRWAVVVLRMIVPGVLVHVQRGPHGGGNHQGLNQHECQEPSHSKQSTTGARRSRFGIADRLLRQVRGLAGSSN
jgi:hypothetical protein